MKTRIVAFKCAQVYFVNTQCVEIPGVSEFEYRAACGLFPTGVTVVTRTSPDGRPYGMTVSSFTSVSLNPPLILVCIDKRAGFGADIVPDLTPSFAFAVNVLREDQQALAVRFSRGSEQERFAGLEWEPGFNGVPLIAGTVASFTCMVENIVEAGDHFIVIGRVQEMHQSGGRPLVWCESGYHYLPDPRPLDVDL